MSFNIDEIRAQLLEMLPKLAANPSEYVIQYGVEEHPEYSFLAAYRIRSIATLAGEQFCIKAMHQGMEGSGNYLGTEPERIVTHFVQALTHFHRPRPELAQLLRYTKRQKYVLRLLSVNEVVTMKDYVNRRIEHALVANNSIK